MSYDEGWLRNGKTLSASIAMHMKGLRWAVLKYQPTTRRGKRRHRGRVRNIIRRLTEEPRRLSPNYVILADAFIDPGTIPDIQMTFM